ncbi:MAG: hypothetical protein Q8S73_21370 [Deltaproteobacteria bacterium]|nr:hypothetical protein [Deltaproteobacteria bacterium]
MEFASVGDVVILDKELKSCHLQIKSIRKNEDGWRVRFQGIRDSLLYAGNGECLSNSPFWNIGLIERTEMARLG